MCRHADTKCRHHYFLTRCRHIHMQVWGCHRWTFVPCTSFVHCIKNGMYERMCAVQTVPFSGKPLRTCGPNWCNGRKDLKVSRMDTSKWKSIMQMIPPDWRTYWSCFTMTTKPFLNRTFTSPMESWWTCANPSYPRWRPGSKVRARTNPNPCGNVTASWSVVTGKYANSSVSLLLAVIRITKGIRELVLRSFLKPVAAVTRATVDRDFNPRVKMLFRSFIGKLTAWAVQDMYKIQDGAGACHCVYCNVCRQHDDAL